MNRRTFLKIAGMGSITFAFGCNPPEKNLFSQVKSPEDAVTGKANWYASTCRECPAGCGILAKVREGRIIKVEGNPMHPINKGKICMRGQAALQGMYNPDRLKYPQIRDKNGWRGISFSKAQVLLKTRAFEAARKGYNRVQMLTEVVGQGLMDLFRESLNNWNSSNPLVYEPFAYESLKTANEMIFGAAVLPSYHIEQADLLLSFGADFLETWLSPVQYSSQFKRMHAVNHNEKGIFIHISAVQNLTGVNADKWLSCRPGSEATVALGLVKQALDIGKGKKLSKSLRNELYRVVSGYTQERVLRDSGISLALYEDLVLQIMGARRPLVLGTPTGMSDDNGLKTNLAVNLLNLLLDPYLRRIDFKNRHRVEIASRASEVLQSLQSLKDQPTELLLLNNVNPVFNFGPNSGVAAAIKDSEAFVVSFSNFMDETSALADLIIPIPMPLETWDEYGGWDTIVSTLQPAMGRITKAPQLGDVFLNSGFETEKPARNYKSYLIQRLISKQHIANESQWVQVLQNGGMVKGQPESALEIKPQFPAELLQKHTEPSESDLVFMAAPSIRFFDGRGANKPWLCEVPDALSRVAWQSPALIHPQTAGDQGIAQEDIIKLESKRGSLEAAVYTTELIRPGTVVMSIGQGHTQYGRYAKGAGVNPMAIRRCRATPGKALATQASRFLSEVHRTTLNSALDSGRLYLTEYPMLWEQQVQRHVRPGAALAAPTCLFYVDDH
ncbi:MAG: hypothetical protein JRF72_08675, partial [Deltaproteobacteria bacterium]|nr:hypothetical protein [Deltaproteobacteria bacterium]